MEAAASGPAGPDVYPQTMTDAGTERVAYYTDLRPGDYEFQVIADNGDGVWNEEGQTMTFTVNPRWWETIWFQVSALAGAVALGVAYFRSRVCRVRRRNTALHREISERKRGGGSTEPFIRVVQYMIGGRCAR